MTFGETKFVTERNEIVTKFMFSFSKATTTDKCVVRANEKKKIAVEQSNLPFKVGICVVSTMAIAGTPKVIWEPNLGDNLEVVCLHFLFSEIKEVKLFTGGFY